MEKVKICTVVTGKNLNIFLKNLDKVQEISDMVELRLDQIKGLTKKDIIMIRKKTNRESIATCRNIETIQMVKDMGFDFIDVDVSVVNLQIEKIFKEMKEKVIISFHNFEKTPDDIKLIEIYKKIKKLDPDVVKIATMVNKGEDNAVLIRLMSKLPRTPRRIIIGMGNKGKVTRVIGPLMGNYLTFASTKDGQTAKGQIDIVKLKEIYKLIT